MTTKQSILLGMVLSWALCWTSSVHGQEGVAKALPQPVPLPTVNLEFSGGTLEDYVTALRDAIPNFNVVMLVPEAQEIRLPAVNLTGVAHFPALRLIEGDYRLGDGSIVRIRLSVLSGEAEELFKIWSERHEIKKPPAEVRVWSIGDLFLGDRKAEQILTAVETAVGLLKNHQPAQIRYHAETTLLLASGDGEQLDAIDRVVDAIRHSSSKPGKLGD